MKERECRGRGGEQSAESRPRRDLPAPSVARPNTATRDGCKGLRSPSWESSHLPHPESRSHSGTPTPRLGLLGGNFPTGRGRARSSGTRARLSPGVSGAWRRWRGAKSGKSHGSRVPAGRGRGRGSGALTTGRTRE